jgi:hypothetical protein
MSAASESPPLIEVEGVPVRLPRNLLMKFEEAADQIQRFYGRSPDAQMLVRLWLASTSPSVIRREFEAAVLGITKPGFEFENDGDEDV